MIERDDLKAAISAGILNEGQAASLAALADSRRGARENLAPGDEPFELFKGFNEIFIVVGLVILATGWAAVTGISVGSNIGGTMERLMIWSVVGAAVLWVLSEYFIRRRRMVAPAIALTLLFAGNAAAGLNAAFIQPFMVMQNDFTSLPLPLVLTTAATFVFWMRFRVPVALAFVALGLFAAAVVYSAAGGSRPETMRDFFLLSAGSNFAWITLALGVCTFVVAMIFDMSDPHRVTRRSANGFWLHVIAAPALVNTVALTLLLGEGPQNTVLLIVFLALMALVAIVIDRRSFLITAVGYVVAVGSTLTDDGSSVALMVLLLGVALLTLGAFWERIRAVILRMFAPALPLNRLPPSAQGSA